MEYILIHLLNGLCLGCILVLVALGLTLIFGLMGVINFAHGVFYACGAYAGYAIFTSVIPNFWAALIFALITTAILGGVIEITLFRKIYRLAMTYQLVLTFGLLLIMTEALRIIFGFVPKKFSIPSELRFTLDLGIIAYPAYRLFILGSVAILVLAIHLFLTKTNVGLNIRAGMQNKEILQVLGVDIAKTYTATFALGCGIAGFAGVMAAPLVGVYPEMGMEILIRSFVVVVVGGIGSLKGSIIAGTLIGILICLTSMVWSEMAEVVIYMFMAIFLTIRPTGMFGEVYF